MESLRLGLSLSQDISLVPILQDIVNRVKIIAYFVSVREDCMPFSRWWKDGLDDQISWPCRLLPCLSRLLPTAMISRDFKVQNIWQYTVTLKLPQSPQSLYPVTQVRSSARSWFSTQCFGCQGSNHTSGGWMGNFLTNSWYRVQANSGAITDN